jgi:AcrR family transcriptional regulator
MEKKLPKGEQTRKSIVDTARRIFNEKGVNLTLDNLAKEMGMPKGRITNHFATKDKLFLTILDDYEQKLEEMRNRMKEHYEGNSIEDVILLLSAAMDVQYEYRCAILFLAVLSPGQVELKDRIMLGKKRNVAILKHRVNNMVEKGLLDRSALPDKAFEQMAFLYLNTMTQWVVYHDMYESDRELRSIKPVYISGIISHVYGPFLSAKGKKQWEKVNVKELTKTTTKKK